VGVKAGKPLASTERPTMHIDAFTVLLLGVCIKILLGALFLMFWLQDRHSTWFAWWSAAFLLGTLASVLILSRGFLGEPIAIAVGAGFVIAAFACCWQGARSFNGRRSSWLTVMSAPGLWLLACLVPGFVAHTGYRVTLSSLILSALNAMAAAEFWRGRREALPSRWPVIVLFGSLSLFFLSRIALIEILPFPFGALPAQPTWIATFNLIVLFHVLMLTVLVVALSKERLELDQRTKAQTDPLTGALNRRAFIARSNRLLQRERRDGSPICLLFFDLDHFKSINDRFGHSAGDKVLASFVDLVNSSIRPTDFLFRIGGEEFCCLLTLTNAEQARQVAERTRQQFEMSVVLVAGTPIKATVSIGIASTEVFGYDLEVLLRRADAAVYAAKHEGRNRVVVAALDDAATPIAAVAAQ
jgi:diguanylate cyclase (GGDEF)-like protein